MVPPLRSGGVAGLFDYGPRVRVKAKRGRVAAPPCSRRRCSRWSARVDAGARVETSGMDGSLISWSGRRYWRLLQPDKLLEDHIDDSGEGQLSVIRGRRAPKSAVAADAYSLWGW